VDVFTLPGARGRHRGARRSGRARRR
jgi:hypothetical protein